MLHKVLIYSLLVVTISAWSNRLEAFSVDTHNGGRLTKLRFVQQEVNVLPCAGSEVNRSEDTEVIGRNHDRRCRWRCRDG